MRHQFGLQVPSTGLNPGVLPQQQLFGQKLDKDTLDKTARSYVATFGFPGQSRPEENPREDFLGENTDEDVSASSRSYNQ